MRALAEGARHVVRTWLRPFGALAALMLLATACSSDRGDDPTAAAGDGSGSATTAGGEGGGDDAFGDLPTPCGEGDASGAPDQGVTADQIVIGYGDDAGFPVSPGLSHETSDAIEAMIAWCNDQGGINGREIVGNYYDAKITEVVNAMTQACDEVFMLVGQAWALDSAQEETRLGCDLPMVPTYSVSADASNAPLAYQSVPNPVDRFTVGGAAQVAELFPDEVKHATVMYGNFAATIDTKDKVLQAFPELGWEFLDCPQEYNIQGESDWRPFVQKLDNCGAEVVYYSGQAYPNMQNLLDAAAQLDYSPIWVTDSNSYLQSFADWNSTGNGDNVYLRTAFTPFEQADDNPATQQYMDIVEGNGGDISQLGEQATSSFLLWATAAKACGDDLTRDCVMDEISQVTSWTGGGLHAESNPGENLPPECSMLLKLDGTDWVQAAPEETGEFSCDPDYIVPLEGRVVEQANLNDDRVSTTYTG
ncbi:MAG TPA: ABC transporter substrate-binding protein [Acidimicrobiales bacterium]